jgi:hypothetical protein
MNYHKAREAQAAGTIRLAWESGNTNLADHLTMLLDDPRLRQLSQRVLFSPNATKVGVAPIA